MIRETKVIIQRGNEEVAYSLNLNFREYIAVKRTLESIKNTEVEQEVLPKVGVYR